MDVDVVGIRQRYGVDGDVTRCAWCRVTCGICGCLSQNSVSPETSFLKRFIFVLLTEPLDRFEAMVGAVTRAAILDGEMDVGYHLCSRYVSIVGKQELLLVFRELIVCDANQTSIIG